MKLVSDQVSQAEVDLICSLLSRILTTVPGDVVEFGCYIGTTSVFLQETLLPTSRQLHVYDSFQGLPEKAAQDHSPAGEQFTAGELLATKAAFKKTFKQAHLPLPVIHTGWFKELTPADVPDQIAFAFLDGDYYQSILQSLKLIWPKLSPGAVVIVDDYNSEQLPGVTKAMKLWAQSHAFTLRHQESLAIITT